eukprot:200376-Amphidinium_carterae.1
MKAFLGTLGGKPRTNPSHGGSCLNITHSLLFGVLGVQIASARGSTKALRLTRTPAGETASHKPLPATFTNAMPTQKIVKPRKAIQTKRIHTIATKIITIAIPKD